MNKKALDMAIEGKWKLQFRMADGNMFEGQLIYYNTNGYTLNVSKENEGEVVRAIVFVDSNNLSDIIFMEQSIGEKFEEFLEVATKKG